MEIRCAICLDTSGSTVQDIQSLKCGHQYCGGCISHHAQHGAAERHEVACPQCQKPFAHAELLQFLGDDANRALVAEQGRGAPSAERCSLSTLGPTCRAWWGTTCENASWFAMFKLAFRRAALITVGTPLALVVAGGAIAIGAIAAAIAAIAAVVGTYLAACLGAYFLAYYLEYGRFPF